ncbi:MAG: hypothetical protein IJI54_13680 [Kiritimatiellae bacterium]|nr:hypothetical protein [Kiritimatiellia bacterium]
MYANLSLLKNSVCTEGSSEINKQGIASVAVRIDNDSVKMRMRNCVSVVLAAAFALCVNLAGADGGDAVEWKAGAPAPGMPHLIMGAVEGQYLPAPGWRFVNAAQDDFTVAPLSANEVLIPAWGGDLRIPAPEGFWTLEDDHPISKLLKLAADADAKNKTVGMWARTESGLWDDVQSAAVKVAHTIYGKCVSLSGFEKLLEGAQEGFNKTSKETTPLANKLAESYSNKMTSLTGTNVNVAVDDVQFLPPYLTDRDRFCFTVIRKERNDVGGEKDITFTVSSVAMLWIRGTVFSLYVHHHVVNNKTDIEAAVAATRDKLAGWIAVVEILNDRNPLDAEDLVAKSNPNCVDPDKEQQRPLESSLHDHAETMSAFSTLVNGLVVDLSATMFVLLLLYLFRRKSRAVPAVGTVPMRVKFVVTWLFTTCVTGLVSSTIPGFRMGVWLFIAPVLVLKPLFAVAILRRRAWPRRVFLVYGCLALFVGIVERFTTPSGAWNDMAAASAFNGAMSLFLYSLLAFGSAETWRAGSEKRDRAS